MFTNKDLRRRIVSLFPEQLLVLLVQLCRDFLYPVPAGKMEAVSIDLRA